MPEAAWYHSLYEGVRAKYKTYGTTNHGAPVIHYVSRMLPSDGVLVDVGCGNAAFGCQVLRNCPDAKIYCIDIANYAPELDGVTFIQGPAWDLSRINDQIDTLTAFDFLEHLHPDDVDRTLSVWAEAKPKRVVVKICPRFSKHTGANGEALHQTVKGLDWWRGQLHRHFGVVPKSVRGFPRFIEVLPDGRTSTEH